MEDKKPTSEKEKSSLSTHEKIQAAASEQQALLEKISATDHAASDLLQTKRSLATLANRVYDAGVLASDLGAKVAKELAEHEAIQGSRTKKLAYAIRGRKADFEALAAKEEQDYVSAKEWHRKAQDSLAVLEREQAALKKQRAALEKEAQSHIDAQNHLEELYANVFDGPSAGFEEDDRLEELVKEAKSIYDRVQERVAYFLQVFDTIQSAKQLIGAAIHEVSNALEASRADIRGTLGTRGNSAPSDGISDSRERSALRKAQKHAFEAMEMVEVARQLQPEIPSLNVAFVDEGDSFVGLIDTWLDNPITDLLFHEKIKDSMHNLEAMMEELQPEFEKWERLLEENRAEGREKQRILDEARQRLLDSRIKAFAESVGDNPPEYKA